MAQVKKAVITAAGRGTRQFPATNTLQKELFPLVDVDGYTKPTLQIIVEETLKSGIEEICVVANPSNIEPMRAHFRGLTEEKKRTQFAGKDWAIGLSDVLDDMEKRITYVVQETQEGYGHAVYQAHEWVGADPFVLMLGDHVYISAQDERCTRQVIGTYETYGCSVSSVSRTHESIINRFGTVGGAVLGDNFPPVYEITAMIEKPSVEQAYEHLRTKGLPPGEYLAFFGIHVFTPTIFDCLKTLIDRDERQKGEIQLTTAQQMLFERERYLVTEVDGQRYDMGVPEGLLETQIALGLRSPYQRQAEAMFCGHKG